MKKQKKQPFNPLYTIISLVILITLIFVIVVQFKKDKTISVVTNDTLKPEPTDSCNERRPLDGLCVVNYKPEGYVAVMIDNQSQAKPQSGINQAGLVYETIAEIPVTRFVAVFDLNDQVVKIGPVRSARPYFLNWASEFKGIYAHVGGSEEALNLLKKSKAVFDLNEFYNGNFFWRDSRRDMPHNAYTSTDFILRAATENHWSNIATSLDSWLFKADKKLEERPASQSVLVDYKSNIYNVKWEYNQIENVYYRYQNGVLNTDENGQVVKAKNVAVMYSDSKIIDDYGRRETQTLGSGEAVVFVDGIAIPGNWKRATIGERTRFYDATGAEIQFNAGLSWINVVPNHFPKVSY